MPVSVDEQMKTCPFCPGEAEAPKSGAKIATKNGMLSDACSDIRFCFLFAEYSRKAARTPR